MSKVTVAGRTFSIETTDWEIEGDASRCRALITHGLEALANEDPARLEQAYVDLVDGIGNESLLNIITMSWETVTADYRDQDLGELGVEVNAVL